MVYVPKKPRLTTRAGVKETLEELYTWKLELKENKSFILLEEWIAKKFSIQEETYLDPASEDLQRLKNAVLSMNKHVKVMEYEQREAEKKERHQKTKKSITTTEWQRQIRVQSVALDRLEKLLEKNKEGKGKSVPKKEWQRQTEILSVAVDRLRKVKEWMQSKKSGNLSQKSS